LFLRIFVNIGKTPERGRECGLPEKSLIFGMLLIAAQVVYFVFFF
jgi:hypothetical protein